MRLISRCMWSSQSLDMHFIVAWSCKMTWQKWRTIWPLMMDNSFSPLNPAIFDSSVAWTPTLNKHVRIQVHVDFRCTGCTRLHHVFHFYAMCMCLRRTTSIIRDPNQINCSAGLLLSRGRPLLQMVFLTLKMHNINKKVYPG